MEVVGSTITVSRRKLFVSIVCSATRLASKQSISFQNSSIYKEELRNPRFQRTERISKTSYL